MPLSPDQIKQILAKKEAKKTRSTGPRTSSGKRLDPNDRSVQAWFSLNHLMMNHDTNEMLWCSNPDCLDPRDKQYGQTVVEVNGSKMCRFCFVEGWLVANPAQATISNGTDTTS